MAVSNGIKGILLIAILATVSTLAVAAKLQWSTARRELTAPEGWAALEKREPQRAASIFRDELTKRPDDPVLHFGAGAAAYAMGRPGPALSSLRKAVDLDPEFPEALALLATVAYERGDAALALRSAEKALELRPRDRALRESVERWRRESSAHGSFVERPAGHFRIMYEGGTSQGIGDRVARVLEREYVRIGRTLNSYPAEPVTVILYTNREFLDITRSPAWATGHYDGRIRVSVGGTLPSGELERVVTHELVHAIVASAATRRLPAWLNEGLATYLESNDIGWTRPVLRRGATIVPLDGLVEGFGRFDEEGALIAYAESATAAAILCEKLGPNIAGFLKLVGEGRSVDQALLEYQVQPDAFHAEWRRRVGLQ